MKVQRKSLEEVGFSLEGVDQENIRDQLAIAVMELLTALIVNCGELQAVLALPADVHGIFYKKKEA